MGDFETTNTALGGIRSGSASTTAPPGGTPSGFPTKGTSEAWGTLTATFTWQEDYANEPRPAYVLVEENTSASWWGRTGSCSDGMSSTPVPRDLGYGETAAGRRFTLLTNPGTTIVRSNTGSASASLPVNTYDFESNPVGCTADVSYKVEIHPVEIQLGGGYTLTAQGTPWVRKYLVGQKMTATLVAGPLSINSLSWSISGCSPFKSYTASNNSATYQGLDASITTNPATSYFAKAGTATVSCTASLSLPPGATGTAGSISVSLSLPIVKPNVTYETALLGAVRLSPAYNGDTIALYDGHVWTNPSWNNGVEFHAQVVTPQEAYDNLQGAKGIWLYAQTHTLNAERFDNGAWYDYKQLIPGTNPKQYRPAGVAALDTAFPYEPFGIGEGQGWEAVSYTQNAYNSPGIAGDAPTYDVTFQAHGTVSELNVKTEPFDMYVMYKPPGDGSTYVPLLKWHWWWKGTVTRPGGIWTASATGQYVDSSPEVDPAHPQWTFRLTIEREWVLRP